MDGLRIVSLEPEVDALEALVMPLCAEILPTVTIGYFRDRLPSIREPQLFMARQNGCDVGFKLGWPTSASCLYSWLGGVRPESRRGGIASQLMVAQHTKAMAVGHTHVETRSRLDNNAMIILNLRHGFRIIGVEIDTRGFPVVLQRKALADGATATDASRS